MLPISSGCAGQRSDPERRQQDYLPLRKEIGAAIEVAPEIAATASHASRCRDEPMRKRARETQQLIAMLEWPLENTRTAERSCSYEAECEVDGQRYSARSRHGAPNKLALLLVSAAVPD